MTITTKDYELYSDSLTIHYKLKGWGGDTIHSPKTWIRPDGWGDVKWRDYALSIVERELQSTKSELVN